ncbi:MAG TPA: GNAT family N-acetyltransferase [Burkholderiaceae bacterium]|nr:GNAT family N-acetyltransferase [Burkholderiaceae bacterium]
MTRIDYRTSIVEDPRKVDAAAWDRLLQADGNANPFVSHAFLSALHASGCATARTGWQPRILTLWQGEHLAAAVPLYAKSHSYGEYVFDWAWADAYRQLGLRYYPKLLVAVPFSPVSGTRLLAADEPARAAAARALVEFAHAQQLSSLHVLLAPRPEVDLLAGHGLLVRASMQFHWQNRGYATFDDFLAALAQPKRKKIRAERRKVAEAGVTLERRVGTGISEADWRFFQRCYEATYDAHASSPYLNLDFFLALAGSMPQNLLLVVARREGRPIASALAVFDEARGVVYGRYWGSLEQVPCLHFECCYYQLIEFAIERGLDRFEGGAQGVHKLARGLDPIETWSAHWLRDPELHAAVRRFIARERASVESAIDELAEHRALKERE